MSVETTQPPHQRKIKVETPRDHALPGYINGVPDLTAFKAGRPDLEDGDDPATGLQDGSHSAGEGGGSMAGIDVGIIFVTGGVRSNDNDPVEGAGPVLNGDHRARS
jgi:hypothetical protein